MRFFDLDSPLMQFLSRMADLLLLNVLTLLCSLPIVTAGAAQTALHYMCLKMAREEEGSITKGYFRSFARNFRQATAIWLLILVFLGMLVADFVILQKGMIPNAAWLRWPLMAVALLGGMTWMYVFAVLARFENGIWATIRNGFLLGAMQPFKTLLMAAVYILPWVILYHMPIMAPAILLFGISVPFYASAKLYNGLFRRLEERIGGGSVPEEDGGERIFVDRSGEEA